MGLTNVYGVPGWGRHGDGPGAALIDGKAIAAEMRREVGEAVAARVAGGAPAPGLATILVGDDPASHLYVASKHRACAEAGIESIDHRLPADRPQAELLALIEDLNADPAVSGILLQLPLPAGFDAGAAIDRIDPRKDVDGLSTLSVGRLWRSQPALAPCTPSGVMELIHRSGCELEGATAVIVGRSELVGKPLAAMLLAANATVTVCHSRTRDLAAVCARADVLVAACGQPAAIGREHVKPGAMVIDVGINRGPDGVVGDVDFAAVQPIAGAITPVPGGVGPMTIACLLRNTLRAAEPAA
ncbi:MAG: bifunctional methylenetetrahydrofolate dehydrogenase/methenyltetrahydrofolate cyclohydrolase FolD [Actinobacteria bacterium]|nr:bifunctional methylenetetrahydrofolate dehydrogenase/methenyltetrahydrofolate cyclohydrolase FolD [Actinomycetota bacterium]